MVRHVILEALSEQLKLPENRDRKPETVMQEWLVQMLLFPAFEGDHVAKSLQSELRIYEFQGRTFFSGKNQRGERILKNMMDFCASFENWQFTRWVHHVKASDFSTAI